MKVTCDRGVLVNALSLADSVAVARTPKPVLQCVKIRADESGLRIASTDLEVAVHLVVHQVQVGEAGEVVVPSAKLTGIVKESVDPTITIEADDETTHIRGADSHFKMFGLPPADFPPVGTFEEEADFQMDSEQLAGLIGRTLFATARETSRYAINGVLLERHGKELSMVATDGRRLAVAKGSCLSGSDEPTQAIIPTKALNLLTKLFHEPQETVRVKVTGQQAMFATETATLTTNLVEGNFPPYQDVIPKDSEEQATFAKDILASAVRRAALLTNEESKGIKFQFGPDGNGAGQLVLSSRAPEMGEAEVTVPMESYSGEGIEIGFNPAFVTDGLKVADQEKVTFEFKAANKPGLMRVDDSFLYVIMPVSLS